jgi:murein DD-endopeptidase MepM/ murein hydrolase activator NlpD
VYHYNDQGFDIGGAGGAVAWPACLARAEATVVPRRWLTGADLFVDLGADIGSARWCRGAATLVAMVAALVHVAPGWRTPSARPLAVPRVAVVHRGLPVARTIKPLATPIARPPVLADDATVRLTGLVGESLYTTLRAAGAAPSVAADYIRAVAPHVDIGEIAPADRYDIVVGHQPGATGGARDGRLLYAGIVHAGQPLSLLRWTLDGREQWLDAAGTGAPSGGFTVPVADARLSSGFGMRFHPILGFSRMHQGVDLAAPLGTPIVSAAEGIVRFAGVHGGYGNFVQVQHGGGMGTGYGHMSGIVVRVGDVVRQGELLGYVGSTGLSTGPHCHFEVYQGGLAIDPLTANFAVAPQLGGAALGRFRAALAELVSLRSSSRT